MALDVIDSVRAECHDVWLTVVDVTEQPAVAVKYRVTATPAIAIDGVLAFRGVPPAHVLRDRILQAKA